MSIYNSTKWRNLNIVLKGKTGKSKKVIVAGVKKVLYKKQESMSMYVVSKGRHMKLTKYKKMKMKGGDSQTGALKEKEIEDLLMVEVFLIIYSDKTKTKTEARKKEEKNAENLKSK